MKLWVDDLREPPEGWTWAKTSANALDQIMLRREATDESAITHISLDHDLGGTDTTRRIVMYLCNYGWGTIKTAWVHTANPVGREWLEGTIRDHGPGVCTSPIE